MLNAALLHEGTGKIGLAKILSISYDDLREGEVAILSTSSSLGEQELQGVAVRSLHGGVGTRVLNSVILVSLVLNLTQRLSSIKQDCSTGSSALVPVYDDAKRIPLEISCSSGRHVRIILEGNNRARH